MRPTQLKRNESTGNNGADRRHRCPQSTIPYAHLARARLRKRYSAAQFVICYWWLQWAIMRPIRRGTSLIVALRGCGSCRCLPFDLLTRGVAWISSIFGILFSLVERHFRRCNSRHIRRRPIAATACSKRHATFFLGANPILAPEQIYYPTTKLNNYD